MACDTEHAPGIVQHSVWLLVMASSLFHQQSCQDKVHGRKEKPRHKKTGAEIWGLPVFWGVMLQHWDSRSQHSE
jgi:hypothetical protein